MNKKSPSNTVRSQVQAFADARSKIAAPAGLSKAAQPFFEAITATRTFSEWSPSDIDIAAQLAEDKALLVALRAELAKKGWTSGGKVAPAAILLNQVHARVLATSRLLQLHPRGRTGKQSSELNARRAAAREAAEVLNKISDNPLIRTQ